MALRFPPRAPERQDTLEYANPRASRPRLDRPRPPARRRRLRGHPAAAVARAVRRADRHVRRRCPVSLHRRDGAAAFGEGSYRYFADPLPPLVQTLRDAPLPAVRRYREPLGASAWASTGSPRRLDGLLDACARSASTIHATRAALRPRWLQLPASGRLRRSDVPAAVPRHAHTPGEDFTGGESVFVEQRPRQQSRPMVARPGQGQAVIFPVRTDRSRAPADTTGCRCATASARCTPVTAMCWASSSTMPALIGADSHTTRLRTSVVCDSTRSRRPG